jgi:HPt (histidine-containing phosphotransfer) domain-containing protein
MALQTDTQSTRPVLDRAKLAGLRELIGEAKCAAAIQRFKGEFFACLAAVEGNAPERAVHAHNLAGVAGLLGFDDLEDESRRFLAALHENNEDIRTSTESLLQAVKRVERELDTIE